MSKRRNDQGIWATARKAGLGRKPWADMGNIRTPDASGTESPPPGMAVVHADHTHFLTLYEQ